MNNPIQSDGLLQSPGSTPPIAKKQWGGATPGSIRARPRSGSGSTSASASRGPPPRTYASNVHSASDSASASAASNPQVVVDDAIARRRAELQRLQDTVKPQPLAHGKEQQ